MAAFVSTLISWRSSSRAILMVISDIARACKGQQINCSIDTVLEYLFHVSTNVLGLKKITSSLRISSPWMTQSLDRACKRSTY